MSKATPGETAAAVPERQVRELDACYEAFYRTLMRGMAPPPTDVELSPQDGRALMTLGRGPLAMSELADTLAVPLSTATRMVERLISKNLAVRSRIEDDRRVVRVEVSDEGKKFFQHFIEQRRAMSRSMLAPLSNGEREIFIELMTKITGRRPTE